MKLTKLYIHNYKSFYDTTIELDKLNIVVGENNSGKSNLIDVLEFIDIAMSKDIERAIDDKGGYDKIKNYSAVGEEKVVVRATFEQINRQGSSALYDKYVIFLENQHELVLSLSFSKKYSIVTVYVEADIKYSEHESIDRVLENLKSVSSLVQNSLTQNIKFIFSHKKYFKQKKEIKKIFFCSKDLEEKIKNNIEDRVDFFFPIKADYFSTYYFNAQSIRTLSNQDSKYSELLKDGSNLGKVLYGIKEKDKNKFKVISNSLIITVNEIDAVEVQKVLGSYALGFKERGIEPISIHTVSDGTINFLATMVALNQPIDKSFMLVFEEPERHLHLNAVSYMLQAFRDSQKQIIITTHSTEIIKYADLKEVVFIYRDSDGDTQSIRADAIPNLGKKMKRLAYERDVTLDELIAEGMMGTFE